MTRKRKQPGLESLFGMNGGSIGSIASMFVAGLEAATAPHQKVIRQLGEWASHFSKSALDRWTQQDMAGTPCVMDGCDGDAVLYCMCCGAPVCLAHAHLSFRAEGICDQCVSDAMAAKQRGPQQRGPSAEDIRSAFRSLGLKQNASWAKVQRAHRELAAKFHPDRARSDEDRLVMEARSKQINAAFDTLRRHYERRAA